MLELDGATAIKLTSLSCHMPGDAFFEALAKSCDIVAGIVAMNKNSQKKVKKILSSNGIKKSYSPSAYSIS